MFWQEEFWIITLIILLIAYILGKSKHLIVGVGFQLFILCLQETIAP